MIPVNRPNITETDRKVLSGTLLETFISGESPPVKLLQRNLEATLNVKHAAAFSSGTTAIDLCVEALGIKPGDICIVPTFTIISTVSSLLRKGAKLLLVDSDPFTWNMDSSEASRWIDKSVKLILPVHIYGLSVDMDPIIQRASETNTFVLEDAAEALGVRYKGKHCGTLGDAGVFSFYANKIVTGGEGGAVVSNSEKFIDRVSYLRNLCFSPEERFVHKELGWNGRISGLAASLASSQLSRLDVLVTEKKAIGRQYLDGLAGHPWFDFQPIETDYSSNLFWVFGAVLKNSVPINAKELQELLKNRGVETRRFFCPIHLQPINLEKQLEFTSDLRNSEVLWNRGLYFPSGLGNTKEEIETVIDILWSLVSQLNKK